VEEIPPPFFRYAQCELQCCVCNEKCVLYYLKNEVWAQVKPVATCCGGHVCVGCAENYLRRPLTLHDLSIENYLWTANRPGLYDQVMHCVVDTVMGAACQAGVPFPEKWCYMWEQYYNLGKKLASQTPGGVARVVELMIQTTVRCFPKEFNNPYETQQG
jgi:hypothetical protein